MKTLSKEFTKNNFHHRQIHREGNLAIYKRWHEGSEYPHFEVIQIQHLKARTFPNGTVQEAGEYYPASTQWGLYGFTCLTKEHAHSRLERIKNEKDS